MNNRYTYKFSNEEYDFFRDNKTMQIIKIPQNTKDRSNKNIARIAINADNDPETYEFYS